MHVFAKEQNQLVNIYICKISYAFSKISYIVYAFPKIRFIYAFSKNNFFCMHPYSKETNKSQTIMNS